MKLNWLTLGLLLLTACRLPGTETTWKAGVARRLITPTTALWMAGYAARTNPAEGKLTELWLKALALEDGAGHRGVIVTCDLVGIKHPIYIAACDALKTRFGLTPDQFFLAASHTHCGPLLEGSSSDTYPLDESQRALVKAYSSELTEKIIQAVGEALSRLAPARLAVGQGSTGFALNRRNNSEPEIDKLLAERNTKGPVEHSVPVLAVYLPDGKLEAVLFGYACHNTTLDGYRWCADYAGFAQAALERSHPDAAALFVMGCGGDQNPLPRRRVELAERYGNMLACAVEEVLLGPPAPLPPTLKTAMETIPLPLAAPPNDSDLEKLSHDSTPAVQRWAARMLKEVHSGKAFLKSYPYPVQAWKLGDRQLLLTLGGEPVVDYALKFKREFGAQAWVFGYCNEVMTYIPSRRVLDEDKPPLASPRWGYEGNRAVMMSGLPACRWADNVEDVITAAARRLMSKVAGP